MRITKQYLRQLKASYEVNKGSYDYCRTFGGTDKEIQIYKERMEQAERILNEAKAQMK